MEENKDGVYLRHILEAIESIEEYLKDFNYEAFLKDKKTIDAVVRELEIIGEAINQLEKTYQEENKSLRDIDIPIEEIVEMRNILIHEYFGVDLELVWDTLKEDLPNLKTQLKNVTD